MTTPITTKHNQSSVAICVQMTKETLFPLPTNLTCSPATVLFGPGSITGQAAGLRSAAVGGELGAAAFLFAR